MMKGRSMLTQKTTRYGGGRCCGGCIVVTYWLRNVLYYYTVF